MKQSKKALAGILTAVMVLNMVVATGITAGAEKADTSTSVSQESEKKEQDGFEIIDDDSREVKDAKKAAEADKKEKEESEKAKEAREKAISQAGGQAAEVVNNLINGKYKNSDEALQDTAIIAAKIFNDAVISNIPYAGGFISAIIGNILADPEEKKDPMEATNQKLDEINESLDKINESINKQGERIINELGTTVISETYVKELNASAENLLLNYYSPYNLKIAKALANLQAGKKLSTDDDNTMKYIFSYGDGNASIERGGTYNLDYYNAFITFSRRIQNKAFLRDFAKYGGLDNIFGINDIITKDGKSTSMETIEERKEFADMVNTFYGNGYEVLRAAMMYEQNKLIFSEAVALAQIDEIDAQIANNEGDLKELYAQRSIYEKEADRANGGYTQVTGKIKDLDAEYGKVKSIIDEQLNLIQEEINSTTYTDYTTGKTENKTLNFVKPVDGINYGEVAFHYKKGYITKFVFKEGTGDFSYMEYWPYGDQMILHLRNPQHGTESIMLYNNQNYSSSNVHKLVILLDKDHYSTSISIDAYLKGVIAGDSYITQNEDGTKTLYVSFTMRDGTVETYKSGNNPYGAPRYECPPPKQSIDTITIQPSSFGGGGFLGF